MNSSMSGLNILVTGAAGFIGSHLVDRLVVQQPAAIVAVDNLFLGRQANLDVARRAYPGLKEYLSPGDDVTNYRRMEEILREENIDVVFDLATIPLPTSLQQPRWSYEQIVLMASNLAELCRLKAFKRLVHCSTSEVYGSAEYVPMDEDHPFRVRTAYAAGKASADLMIQSYVRCFGIDALIVRPFNAYGPRQNDANYAGVIPIFIKTILSGGRPVVYGDGRQTRDFTFVTDTAEGILKAAMAEQVSGSIVNVASGHETEVLDLGQILYDLAGEQFRPDFAPPRIGDVRRHLAKIDRLKELCCFSPAVTLREGLGKTLEWYRASRVA